MTQLKRYFRAWSPIRQRADAEARAREMIAEHGPAAYDKARELSRSGRPFGSGRKDRFYVRVALRIAALTHRDIGVTGAERRPPL